MRWNTKISEAEFFNSPEFLEIKKKTQQIAEQLKEEYKWYKKPDSKFPHEMNQSPAQLKRMIIEQIRLMRMLDKQKVTEQEYLDNLIKQYEEQNYGH